MWWISFLTTLVRNMHAVISPLNCHTPAACQPERQACLPPNNPPESRIVFMSAAKLAVLAAALPKSQRTVRSVVAWGDTSGGPAAAALQVAGVGGVLLHPSSTAGETAGVLNHMPNCLLLLPRRRSRPWTFLCTASRSSWTWGGSTPWRQVRARAGRQHRCWASPAV